MRLSVSLGLWQDRPADEAVRTAQIADEQGYAEVWVGEMATYDAFALATAIGMRTRRVGLTVGPLAVTVRDPMMIAMGAASVADLTGRPVHVALGTSSPVVVEEWHGRSRAGASTALREAVQALRPLLDGDKSAFSGAQVSCAGYRLRLPAPRCELTVAAFGPAAVGAAALADRMVLNLLTPASAARLITDLRLLNPATRVAAWVVAAVDPDPAAVEQVRRGVLPYLAAPGYGEMFAEAGFADIVAYARTRPHPRDLLPAIPDELLESVALLGDSVEIMDRLDAYAEAGVDEVALVPVSTDTDPYGETTLKALAEGPSS
ncbi:LLM class F420-dependent oxidoreductase [Sphaerisporangium siamense]|uniref:Putative F420-dependent oxidoreductase n=1 Tax=Sphaerisporangium siamense TaxID=795645 RepID=A0A7W7DHD1_9ACTN|nr:LLM class F420-dependent oxidoreductase [Sphaerisporangium siamense]MBB4705771.1 putative F420-dependent oxidoreductase [Sphaerisporangium siamense]GII82842.1 LLM class F420-dependent oxidoreductase [Sphaerisporangium siamense]